MVDQTPSATLKLGTENTKQLQELETVITKAKHGIEQMKSLGIDVKDLEDKLSWAQNVRDTLLREFS